MAESVTVRVRVWGALPRATAVSFAGLSAGVAVVGVAVVWAAAPGLLLSGHAVEDALTSLLWSGLGLLLALKAPRSRYGWLFLSIGSAAAVAVAGGAVGELRDGVASAVGAWLGSWLWFWSTFAPITVVPALFPDRGWRDERSVTGLALGGVGMASLGLAASDPIWLTPTAAVPNPLAMGPATAFVAGGGVLVLAAAIVSLTRLGLRLRAATEAGRRQFAPVVAAVFLTLLATVLSLAAGGFGPALQLLAAPLIPGAVTWAVLRRRLYDLELVVRRSLVFVLLSLLLLACYVVVVETATLLLHRAGGLPESVLGAAAVALVFQPARLWLQRLIGRILYGERDDPVGALGDIARRLSSAADPAAAVTDAADGLARALRVPWLCIDGTTACHPVGTRPSWAQGPGVHDIALVHAGAQVGVLRLSRREPTVPLDARDLRLAGQLSIPVAAALAAAAHVTELQRSRDRIVVAREEERRRIRRDLHDGLGPLLTALTTHVDVAKLRSQRDLTTVPELLERIGALGTEAVGGLRRVVDDLRPATVNELGLAGALGLLAESFDAPGLQVSVDIPAEASWPAETELTIYRIAAEAMTNAARHSGAQRISVSLHTTAECAVLVVSDDGAGLPVEHPTGIGLASMRERAATAGGILHIGTCDGGGTTVVAELPRRHLSPPPGAP